MFIKISQICQNQALNHMKPYAVKIQPYWCFSYRTETTRAQESAEQHQKDT